MTMQYSNDEAAILRQRAAARGEVLDLYPCADGILRSAEDKREFESTQKFRDSNHWLDAPK